MILNEQIYYSVAGMADALDKLRKFALARGWTIDYWQPSSAWDTTTPFGWIAGDETNLQMFSNGYGNQGMVYRMRAKPTGVTDPAESKFYSAITQTADRNHSLITTHPMSQDTLLPLTSYTNWQSTPVSTFDSVYFYGNEKFISMTLKVTSMSVITYLFGTIELFRSWESYVNGLYFLWSSGSNYSYNTNYKWYNIDSNPQFWYLPGAALSYRVSFEQLSGTLANNYQPTGTIAIGSEVGGFNRMMDFLWFNTFTDKRLAFQQTIFVKDPVGGTYYPCGRAPFAYINGTNLTFGQTVNFGTEVYKCYPAINIPNPIWVAYRTA